MKSLEELKAIKAKMQDKVALRTSSGDVRIVVGMATCGIAAGARPVLNAFVEGVNAEGLASKVSVTQTGCIGLCQYEPIVEVLAPGKEKVTYGNNGCVDCDECSHRSEDCLCDISDNDGECPLI